MDIRYVVQGTRYRVQSTGCEVQGTGCNARDEQHVDRKEQREAVKVGERHRLPAGGRLPRPFRPGNRGPEVRSSRELWLRRGVLQREVSPPSARGQSQTLSKTQGVVWNLPQFSQGWRQGARSSRTGPMVGMDRPAAAMCAPALRATTAAPSSPRSFGRLRLSFRLPIPPSRRTTSGAMGRRPRSASAAAPKRP